MYFKFILASNVYTKVRLKFLAKRFVININHATQ